MHLIKHFPQKMYWVHKKPCSQQIPITLRHQISLRLHRERENSWKEIKAFVRKEGGKGCRVNSQQFSLPITYALLSHSSPAHLISNLPSLFGSRLKLFLHLAPEVFHVYQQHFPKADFLGTQPVLVLVTLPSFFVTLSFFVLLIAWLFWTGFYIFFH